VSRILVIDDEAALGENIQRMLREPGTTVCVCTDPVRGLQSRWPTRPTWFSSICGCRECRAKRYSRACTRPTQHCRLSSSLHLARWKAQ